MHDTLLVITPQASFGELIRQTLEETGRYRVEVTYQAADALARCRRPGGYRLIILDGDVSGPPLETLVAEIRSAQPAARLALIPPEHPQDPQAIQSLPVDGALGKPFYLPTLAATVDRLISGGAGEAAEAAPGEASTGGWPEDAAARRAELERRMERAGAIGAIFIEDEEIRAEAGCAAGDWSAGVLAALCGSPSPAGDAELVLFHPAPDGAGTALVYAILRRDAGTFALVYPSETTYSQARARVRAAMYEERGFAADKNG